ncbi:MAG TPA: aminomethyltransferase family protein [Vicinamibacteria bacterium]|nr:aminomethyltransferase family protein [Vicinamibacteria bacterium]
MAIGTPFHSRTAPLCTSLRWKQWSGYFVAVVYDDFHDPEYHAIRSGAGLIDVSPLFKYDIRGPDAERLVDRVITRDATKCQVGQVLYAAWCDDEGKILQDGCFQRLDKDFFRATAAEQALSWFTLNAEGMNVSIEDVSESYGALALQGPRSREILQSISTEDLTKLRFFRLARTELRGVPVVVSRTGYTGDLGYEIWVEAERAESIWDALMDAGEGLGIEPAGMGALDRTRVEAGFPLIDVDFWNAEKTFIESQKSTPYEINMGWAVNFNKGPFVGKRALAEANARGMERFFVGLEVPFKEIERLYALEGLAPQLSNEASRLGVPVYADGRQVGKATTTCWSTLLKKYIALATVDKGHEKPETPLQVEFTVEYVRRRASAKVTGLPFFDPERKRSVP